VIFETHARECEVCEMIERKERAAGAYYFAGAIAALAPGKHTPLCPVHFIAWKKVEAAFAAYLPKASGA
jgi:hypothetical protein